MFGLGLAEILVLGVIALPWLPWVLCRLILG